MRRPLFALPSSARRPGSHSAFRSAGRPWPCSPALPAFMTSSLPEPILLFLPGRAGSPLSGVPPPCSASLDAPSGCDRVPLLCPVSCVLVGPVLMTGSFPPHFQASPLPAAHAACLALLFLCVSCLSLVLRDGDQTPHPTSHNRLCVMQVSSPVCTQEDGNFCSHDSQLLTSNTGSQQIAHGSTKPHYSETHLPGA